MKRLATGGLLAVALVVLLAAPASAHAELETTDPVGGSALEESPQQIVLTFTEPVEVSIGSIRLFDSDGERVDAGTPHHPKGQGEAVALNVPELDDGAYVVTWRAISADSHPVHGAFSFRVGDAAGTDTEGLLRELLAEDGGSTAVGALYGIVRFAAFAALIVLVGGTTFVLGLWPAGAGIGSVRRLLAVSWVVAVVSTALGIGLQGAYAAGLGISDAFRWSVVDSVLDTRFGRVWLIRLVLLAAAAVVLVLLGRQQLRRPVRRALIAVAAVVGVGLLLTPGMAGHAGSADPAWSAETIDLIHLAGASFWLGGLAVLLLVLLRRGEPADVDLVVPRFSRAAFVAVIVIAGSGLAQGWREVGSLDALTETTYGRLLLVKVGLFVAMVGVAGLSRGWVRRRYILPRLATSPGPGAMAAEPRGAAVARLRRSVGAEVAIGAAVLAITALLVNAVPGKTALAQPFSTELDAGELLVDLTIDPAKRGPADIHLYTLTPEGQVAEVEDFTAELSLPERDIGPIEVPLERAGPGHFAAYGFELPIAGEWELEVVALLSDVDQVEATTTVDIR